MGVERVSVAIDADLLRRFDRLLERRGLGNRSEAIRDLIRRRLVEEEAQRLAGDAVGSLTLVYDHEQRTLSDRLVERGHHHRARVLSTLLTSTTASASRSRPSGEEPRTCATSPSSSSASRASSTAS